MINVRKSLVPLLLAGVLMGGLSACQPGNDTDDDAGEITTPNTLPGTENGVGDDGVNDDVGDGVDNDVNDNGTPGDDGNND
ncbi:hypothetical protein HNR42_000840 [Deinobacterium chartae]|uniref:Uncharacterized protein n=1 Tax=Deinobacterium chartae TaxID=521158 RepID=A0A841HX43_9DEIO|nr:hypothetical protein [Deinobacterium chartae]MBB6097423.1 hypothetical protein [Deinobacterium chartae]